MRGRFVHDAKRFNDSGLAGKPLDDAIEGTSPHASNAAQWVIDELLVSLEMQMPAVDPDPQGGARYLLALIEGTQLPGVVGHERIAREGLVAGGL